MGSQRGVRENPGGGQGRFRGLGRGFEDQGGSLEVGQGAMGSGEGWGFKRGLGI